MEKQHLIDYLTTVVELEKRCYEQRNILTKLNKQHTAYKNPQLTTMKRDTRQEPEYNKEFYFHIAGSVTFIVVFSALFLFSSINSLPGKMPIEKIVEAFLFFIFSEFWSNLGHALVLGLTWGAILSILVFVIVLIFELSFHKKEFSKAKEKYIENGKLLEEENAKIAKNNNRFVDLCNYKADIMSDEYQLVKKEYNNTASLLQQYYDLNVIYPKYRNLVCVSSILEYFLSGRCETLTGHEGAYNILESDIKFGVIVSKLDTVIAKLDEIKTNQSLLYDSIQECNSNITKVSNDIINSVKKIESTNAEANKQIISHLNSIDYTARLTQINTQYLADMKHYEIWLR